jgi:regulator of replication initiation timing
MEITGFDIVNIVAPLVTLIGGWFFGRKKQKNDFINDLQASIDLLSQKNKELIDEVVALREEVARLRTENSGLRGEVEELNRRLEKVKTITKKA